MVRKHTKVMQYHAEGNARQVLDRLMSLENLAWMMHARPLQWGLCRYPEGPMADNNRATKQIRAAESSHWRGALSMDRSVRRRAED